MHRPHLPGPIERHPKTTIITTTFILALGGLELAGYFENPTEPVPVGACESPFASTGTYVDPNGSDWKTNAGIGEGVIVTVKLPRSAEGVVAGFRNPEAKQAWQTSAMMAATGSIAVKFAIGQGDVAFGLATVSQNPADCATAPEITDTTWRGAGDYFDAPGQLPWPNLTNEAINALP